MILVLLGTACNVGLYQGPDRPDDYAVLGPPPPTDFHCERGHREVRDTNNDKRPDTVIHILDGNTICQGTDSNNDGRIDTWNHLEQGRVVEQARDTDYDGTLDQRARDTDGDGKLEIGTPAAPLPPGQHQ